MKRLLPGSLRRSKYDTSTWPFRVTASHGWNWSASAFRRSWLTRAGPVYETPPSVDLNSTTSEPEPGLSPPSASSSRGSRTCGCLGFCPSSSPSTTDDPSPSREVTATYTLPLRSTPEVGIDRFRNCCVGNGASTPTMFAIGRAGVNVSPWSVDLTCMSWLSELSYQVT